MDLTQLQTIIQVAETGSISKASERLNIVQPALSRKLGNLERELGITLFERNGRGMMVTDVGREILKHSVAIMAELEAIRQLSLDRTAPLRGEVTVGITPTIAEIVTVPLLEKARKAHPELSIRFTSAFSGYLLDWLHKGEVDLTFSYETREVTSIQTRPAMIEELLLVGAFGQFSSKSAPLEFANLAGERLILPGSRHGLRKILDDIATEKGFSLKPSVEVDSLNAMIALVRAGFGSTILPLPPVLDHVEQKQLSFRRLTDPVPRRTVVIASSSLRPVLPAARFVESAFLQVVQEMVDRERWMGTFIEGPGI